MELKENIDKINRIIDKYISKIDLIDIEKILEKINSKKDKRELMYQYNPDCSWEAEKFLKEFIEDSLKSIRDEIIELLKENKLKDIENGYYYPFVRENYAIGISVGVFFENNETKIFMPEFYITESLFGKEIEEKIFNAKIKNAY